MIRNTAIACAFAATALSAAPPVAAEETLDYVIRPVWTRTPTSGDMRNYYPARAGQAEGRVRLDCQITTKGALSNCIVRSETPTNLDFGAASLKLARLFRMKPEDAEGKPVADRWLSLPINWLPTRQ